MMYAWRKRIAAFEKNAVSVGVFGFETSPCLEYGLDGWLPMKSVSSTPPSLTPENSGALILKPKRVLRAEKSVRGCEAPYW